MSSRFTIQVCVIGSHMTAYWKPRNTSIAECQGLPWLEMKTNVCPWGASCETCWYLFFFQFHDWNTMHFTRLTAICDVCLLTEFTFPLASQSKHGQGNGLLWHAGCKTQRHPWRTEEGLSQNGLEVSPWQKPCRRREGAPFVIHLITLRVLWRGMTD